MELRLELRGRSRVEYWANRYDVANDTCIETLVLKLNKEDISQSVN